MPARQIGRPSAGGGARRRRDGPEKAAHPAPSPPDHPSPRSALENKHLATRSVGHQHARRLPAVCEHCDAGGGLEQAGPSEDREEITHLIHLLNPAGMHAGRGSTEAQTAGLLAEHSHLGKGCAASMYGAAAQPRASPACLPATAAGWAPGSLRPRLRCRRSQATMALASIICLQWPARRLMDRRRQLQASPLVSRVDDKKRLRARCERCGPVKPAGRGAILAKRRAEAAPEQRVERLDPAWECEGSQKVCSASALG